MTPLKGIEMVGKCRRNYIEEEERERKRVRGGKKGRAKERRGTKGEREGRKRQQKE